MDDPDDAGRSGVPGFPDGPRSVHHPLRTRRGGGWRAFAVHGGAVHTSELVEPALPASPSPTRPSPWRARRPRRTPRARREPPRARGGRRRHHRRGTVRQRRRGGPRAPPWRRPTATRTTPTRTRTPRKPPRDTSRPRPRRPRPKTTTRSTRTQTRMVSSPRPTPAPAAGGTPRRPPTRRRPIPSVPSIPSIPSVPRLSGGNTPTSNVETPRTSRRRNRTRRPALIQRRRACRGPGPGRRRGPFRRDRRRGRERERGVARRGRRVLRHAEDHPRIRGGRRGVFRRTRRRETGGTANRTEKPNLARRIPPINPTDERRVRSRTRRDGLRSRGASRRRRRGRN